MAKVKKDKHQRKISPLQSLPAFSVEMTMGESHEFANQSYKQ